MMTHHDHAEPQGVVQEVEHFVDTCRADARRASNVELLDEGQVYSLHMLVAKVYAAGFDAGRLAERERLYAAERRRKDDARHAERLAAEKADGDGACDAATCELGDHK